MAEPEGLSLHDWLDEPEPELSLNDEEIDEFVRTNRAKNTVKKTESDLQRWKDWCATIGEMRSALDIPSDDLNRLLCHFFVKARSRSGNEYEPDTLTGFQRSIDRYLRENGRTRSIITDREFQGSREALQAKRKALRSKGKGRRPNASDPLTKEEEDLLWERGQLGDHNPEVLVRTSWYTSTMHFGWRSRDEQRKVCLGDFQLKSDLVDGKEYLELCVERGTKTRTGLEGQRELAFNPRMYATGDRRCPIAIFKKMVAHRPPDMMKPDDPFYLQTIPNPKGDVWFKRQPMGVNKLGSLMKSIAASAALEGKKTNHSARKTMITRLMENSVPPLMAAQLSGHKSLDSYSHASIDQQKAMSLTISHQCQSRGALHDISNSQISSSVSRSTSSSSALTLLHGASISGGAVTVNIYNQNATAPMAKKRRVIIEDSDSD